MNLLKKDEKFVCNEAQDKAFTELREHLCLESLQYPNYQYSGYQVMVTMDASGYAIRYCIKEQ